MSSSQVPGSLVRKRGEQRLGLGCFAAQSIDAHAVEIKVDFASDEATTPSVTCSQCQPHNVDGAIFIGTPDEDERSTERGTRIEGEPRGNTPTFWGRISQRNSAVAMCSDVAL